jgi:hypothetical protein
MAPKEADKDVTNTALTALSLMAHAEPPLNPNHPNLQIFKLE